MWTCHLWIASLQPKEKKASGSVSFSFSNKSFCSIDYKCDIVSSSKWRITVIASPPKHPLDRESSESDKLTWMKIHSTDLNFAQKKNPNQEETQCNSMSRILSWYFVIIPALCPEIISTFVLRRNEGNPLLQIEVEPTSDVSAADCPVWPLWCSVCECANCNLSSPPAVFLRGGGGRFASNISRKLLEIRMNLKKKKNTRLSLSLISLSSFAFFSHLDSFGSAPQGAFR